MLNRTFTISMQKKKKDDETTDTVKEDNFDQRADQMLLRVEDLMAKAFLGVCAYILLDTFRQVQVAKTIYRSNDS